MLNLSGLVRIKKDRMTAQCARILRKSMHIKSIFISIGHLLFQDFESNIKSQEIIQDNYKDSGDFLLISFCIKNGFFRDLAIVSGLLDIFDFLV